MVGEAGRAAGRRGLIGWTLVAMVAFAANSVLNRVAVGGGLMEPAGFAVLRLAAGAAMLVLLVALRRRVAGGVWWPGLRGRLSGVAGLLAYLFGFSAAYLVLGAGAGALILFGMVQITMFAGAVLAREEVPARRWIGAAVAFGGLLVLFAPGGGAISLPHAGAMVLAGIGWGVYSLAGRGQADALAATAANFVLALPVGLLVLLVVPFGKVDATGALLAVTSGAITSGLGYALWYRLVPQLGAARAGVAQLSVPVIAALGGVALGEAVGLRLVLASALVMAGVALGLVQGGRAGRKGA